MKSFLAGKKGICPHCGTRFRIPLEDSEERAERIDRSAQEGPPSLTPHRRSDTPTGTALALRRTDDDRSLAPSLDQADLIEEVPEARWYVRAVSGEQFGPATAETMQNWLNEGRIPPTAYVWREGWDEWRVAGTVFTRPAPVSASRAVTSSVSSAAIPRVDVQAAAPVVRVSPSRRPKKSTYFIVGWLVLLCLALLLALLWVTSQ